MSAAFSNRTARRRAITYVALLASTLVLIAGSGNPVVVELQRGIGFAFRPAQSALDGLGRNASSIVAALGEIDQLRLENEALRAENARIRGADQQAQELRRENELLTGLLQLRNGFDYDTVAADVIGRESSEVQARMTLDRGTDDGVAIGDVVVAAGGALVGRIVDAGPTSSTVQLISDPASTVIGLLVSSAATGEVTGQLPDALLMENIDAAVNVALGDEVVTAGIELTGGLRSPYPKGLLIGQVIDVQRDANEIVQTAFLKPAVGLASLEYVLVVTNYSGGLPPADVPDASCGPTASPAATGAATTSPGVASPSTGPSGATTGEPSPAPTASCPAGYAGPTTSPAPAP